MAVGGTWLGTRVWRRRMRVGLAGGLLAAGVFNVAAYVSSGSVRASGAAPGKIGHVWVVFMENETEANSFTPSSSNPYLSQVLPSMGVLVPRYYGIGHQSLDNYTALVSGQ